MQGSVDSQAIVASFDEHDINVEGRADFIQKCACTQMYVCLASSKQNQCPPKAYVVYHFPWMNAANDFVHAGLDICHDLNLSAEDVALKIQAAIVNNDIQGDPKGEFFCRHWIRECNAQKNSA